MIRSKNHVFDLRLRLVLHANSYGIKSAARTFGCSINTVRKWVRRHKKKGRMGLNDLSRAPHSCPHKLSKEAETKILSKRDRAPCFGPLRLKDSFDLPWGVNAIGRVLREHGKTRKRKRKHKVKNDLRAVKASYKPFTRFQMDTKYLNDIPYYWPQMMDLGLPRFQYTIRELSCGAENLAYGSEISTTYAELTISRFLRHLQQHGVDLTEVVIQSDNGPEFDGRAMKERDRGFTHTVEADFHASHRRIPPGCKNAQADVETVHNLIENELLDLENYRHRLDFFVKTNTYQNYFNIARPNWSRGKKSPLDLLEEKAPHLNASILLLPVLDLDACLLAQGGHDVPVLVEITGQTISTTRDVAWIKIEPDLRYSALCYECKTQGETIHSNENRNIRDLNLATTKTYLDCDYRKVICTRCDSMPAPF